nr:MAG TPA: Homeobox-cysteine loop-homeobox [Caudoviricetes sp.]
MEFQFHCLEQWYNRNKHPSYRVLISNLESCFVIG